MNTINDIHEAREAYFNRHPFNPFKVAVPSRDKDGNLIGLLSLPDRGELEVLGCRLGMEYLAICHDTDEVHRWINRCIDLAGDEKQIGMIFGFVFQGINLIIAENLQTNQEPNMRRFYTQLAIHAWEKDFGESESDDD